MSMHIYLPSIMSSTEKKLAVRHANSHPKKKVSGKNLSNHISEMSCLYVGRVESA